MVRKIIEWSDKKYDEALKEENTAKGLGKALLSGVADGVVNGCFIVGSVAFVLSTIDIIKGLKK